ASTCTTTNPTSTRWSRLSTVPPISSASDQPPRRDDMPGLEDLYREIILDHYRTPRNRGELPVPPARHAEGHNPLCGDEITVFLDVSGEGDQAIVDDVKVSGQGCSISQSSASMMSAAVKGKSVGEVRALVRKFKGMMSIESDDDSPVADVPLGDLEALQGVV